MTINYTTLLGLAQPVTGTEQGTWGDTVNTEITALLEDAIADAATFSVTSGDVTLTSTAGQANQARMAILLVTGTPGVSRNIIAPSQSKWYIVKNSSDASVVLKGSATTGVTILAGTEALCFWNGSDFEIVGVNGPSSSTDNAVVRFDGTTGKVIQNSGVIIDDSNNVSGMGTLGVGAITTTGVFTATAGTVSAPAITTTGDTNTGIFFPAADTIAFAEGGVEAMRIDSSGNVGIGTSALNFASGGGLIVYNNGGQARLILRNDLTGSASTDGFQIIQQGSESGNTNVNFQQAENSAMLFSTNATERMRIDSSGYLLVGATSSVGTGASRLQIGSSGGTAQVLLKNSTGHAAMYSSGTESYWTTASGGFLAFGQAPADGSTFTERMRIDSSGRVMVGATSSTRQFAVRTTVAGNSAIALFENDSASNYGGLQISAGGTDRECRLQSAYGNSFMTFWTENATTAAERMRIDSSGNVGIGTNSPASNLDVSAASDTGFSLRNSSSVTSGNRGSIYWLNSSVSTVAHIRATAVTDNVGTDLSFATRPAAGSLTERMRINSAGEVLIGRTTDSDNAGVTIDGNGFGRFNSNGVVQVINRLPDDGDLVLFRQASVTEGTISVSGTTVSYNGGNLSRYAQLTVPKDETNLLKGTVMSNLDEMNVYVAPTTYWTEEDELPEGVSVGDVKVETHTVANEQLNKVKVSDVEGDVNVAGVFVNWSYDEQHQVDEINMAMTGDMIIRIAQGVVVQKGDLLMSAGDGTAKPQGDDIVRSKTVAKVTSNHVTCTYEDGSYCVPCVLMAC